MTAPRPLSYWVRTLDSLLQDEFARAAEATGLDRGQWHVLTRLRVGAVADDVLVDGLAPFLVGDDTVDDVVGRATSDGLVEHQGNEYRLTTRGAERVDEVEEKALGELRGRAFDGLSEEEESSLFAALERVATNLGWEPA